MCNFPPPPPFFPNQLFGANTDWADMTDFFSHKLAQIIFVVESV